jgi:hypothetical protein
MAVRATFEIAGQDQAALIQEIFNTSQDQSELTPRSISVLRDLAQRQALAVVFVDQVLAGWAAVEPLARNLSEVGMVYVKPEFRGAAVFNKLMQVIAARPERMLLATYDKSLIRYVVSAWQAKQTNLFGAIVLSRGKFLTKRLNAASGKAIRNKLQKSKPLYAIVGER